MRHLLAIAFPQYFAWGEFVTLDDLLSICLQTPNITLLSTLTCQHSHSTVLHSNHTCLISSTHLNGQSIQAWLTHSEETSYPPCQTCQSATTRQFQLSTATPLLVFEFPGQSAFIDDAITLNLANQVIQYKLKGIIYYGDNHFTSRIISDDRLVWYHDGMTTGSCLLHEGPLPTIPNLMLCKNKDACAAIYSSL